MNHCYFIIYSNFLKVFMTNHTKETSIMLTMGGSQG